MKRNCWVLTVFLVAGVSMLQFGCREQAGRVKDLESAGEALQAVDANELKPEITFDKLTYDFGKVGQGTKSECEFKFTNTGKGLLKVDKKIKSTCGCTVPELSREEYASGESGTIKVVYHAGRSPGVTTKQMYVNTNDNKNLTVLLSITADVMKVVDYKPDTLKVSLKGDTFTCSDITLTGLDDTAFSITKIESTAQSVTADFNSAVEAKQFVLKPRVNIGKMEKSQRGNIKIYLTHPACNLVIIPFEVRPEFVVTPSMVSIIKAVPQEPVERQVWILNSYDEDFEVESTSSAKGIVKLLKQEKVGKRYSFDLQITPPPVEGQMKYFSDVFYIQLKGGKKLEVICRGFYERE